jgi:DNA-binding CsgD family transcriptional regulator
VHAAELVAAKADGIVVSSPDPRTLIECVESVARGIRWVDPDLLGLVARTRSHPSADAQLTWREREIVQCVVRGLRNKVIARELNVSEGTIKMHLHHIFAKLKVQIRTELALSFSQGLERQSDGSIDGYDIDCPDTPTHAGTPGPPDISGSLQVRPRVTDSIVVRQRSLAIGHPLVGPAKPS